MDSRLDAVARVAPPVRALVAGSPGVAWLDVSIATAVAALTLAIALYFSAEGIPGGLR